MTGWSHLLSPAEEEEGGTSSANRLNLAIVTNSRHIPKKTGAAPLTTFTVTQLDAKFRLIVQYV